MSNPQHAIVPEAGTFALYSLFKISSEPQAVLSALQTLPSLIKEVNDQQEADVKLSVSFTHQFWSKLNQPMPGELEPFRELGKGDINAPATDVDFLIHCHSDRHDLHFFVLRKFLTPIAEHVELVDETYGYRYLDSRDMTEFVDGTENPKGDQRHDVAIIPEGDFAGGSYVMVQRFVHNLPAWNRLNVSAQEKVVGRTKPDSIELDDVPAASHVGRVDIKEEGKGLKIVRHSLPYGSVSGEHGLLFIAYCQTLHNFKAMLESMYGETDGKTDQLLRFTSAVTGAYFFAPSDAMLSELALA
ncbi:putative Dyp-type peroxidase [Vibrio nigripulchritudo SFn27]|uniref:Putative Dyp-type peroxidase n=1 Tax=Vibrio nigripulchritudo TaxID=28173 RepID=U4JVJ4_9VIBR|nr:Dyp-type peroxidase [Vibrio nigripulchritudo]CCN81809.1 putative Dyp-type peroxidase [Vibrio nigripulchritudo BLFn1]CCN88277.1 putative Dyp-type peroxidase [Vibrio nigripulchritudo SFn27]CCN95267.1 putative Dyp-type peroxidase [Vibrio nigripulchritudo ENn2]CCO41264.1 putative Dyp-type peroxidase [Vibrio nigripulchritudo SFn135]CCO53963.1 putative Dyp-type peroxidase [Vibrio nigripulchritudo Wn13]